MVNDSGQSWEIIVLLSVTLQPCWRDHQWGKIEVVSGIECHKEGSRRVIYREEVVVGSSMPIIISLHGYNSIVWHNSILPKANGQTASMHQHCRECSLLRSVKDLRFYSTGQVISWPDRFMNATRIYEIPESEAEGFITHS